MRHDRLQAFGQHPLMHRIGVGMQQGHRHALHTGLLQPCCQTIDLAILQRLQHVAFVIKPLNQTKAKLARHQ